jgi:hypothetical protein
VNKDVIGLVESLGGTVLFGGALIQFTDATFMAALKKIYESGALEEREACAKVAQDESDWNGDVAHIADLIRARGQA